MHIFFSLRHAAMSITLFAIMSATRYAIDAACRDERFDAAACHISLPLPRYAADATPLIFIWLTLMLPLRHAAYTIYVIMPPTHDATRHIDAPLILYAIFAYVAAAFRCAAATLYDAPCYAGLFFIRQIRQR